MDGDTLLLAAHPAQGVEEEVLVAEEPHNVSARMLLLDYYQATHRKEKRQALLRQLLRDKDTPQESRYALILQATRQLKDENTDQIMAIFDDALSVPQEVAHGPSGRVEKGGANKGDLLDEHQAMQDVFDDGRLFLNFAEQTAMLGGKPLTLSTLEFRMLNLFCQNRNRVLTRKQLLEKIWDCTENYVDEHTLTTTLSRIRGKIETDGTVYIKTVYGMGYKWTGGETA